MPVDDQGRFFWHPELPMLHPEEQVFAEMLRGWRNEQLARGLAISTVRDRDRVVKRFADTVNEYPWNWTVGHVNDYFADRRTLHGNALTTIRGYQNALDLFVDYACDDVNGWNDRCEHLFGTHPTRVIHQWNLTRHVLEVEHGGRRRPFTPEELQAFFDRADDEADEVARKGRKGWAAAFRDATVFKVAYLFGLRRNEVRHLQIPDFSRNPEELGFGAFGHVNVRFGKAARGSGYKQRNTLAVFKWGTPIIKDWLDRGLPVFGNGIDLFPTERQTLVSESALNTRFRRFRDDIGVGREVTFHSFRRSYITHLLEMNVELPFIQEQVGHEYASTTAIYSAVSSDFRRSALRRALDGTFSKAFDL